MQEDTNTLASLDPDTGLIRSVDGGTPLAWWWDGNPLRGQMPALADRPAPLIVMWSGTSVRGPVRGASADLADAGTRGPRAMLRRASTPPRGSAVRVCFRPHRRHVLSDTPSCVRFLAGHPDEPFGLALCPGDLLEPEMQDDVEDHLVRIFETLGPRADLVLLESAARRWTRRIRDRSRSRPNCCSN